MYEKIILIKTTFHRFHAQSVGAIEYTDCMSAERQDTPKECPRYDIKQSDDELPGNEEYLFIAIAPRSTLAWSGSTWYGPIYGSNRTKLCNHVKLNCLK